MYNIIRALFLFFLYLSNAFTILSVYPISYYLIENTSRENKWYFFGLIFSIYEIGKFCGISVWDSALKKNSKLFLVLISLFSLALLNIAFGFVTEFYHILILRFCMGFSNITGTFFRDIYIQVGFRKNNKINLLVLSIICTTISLFFPSLIIYFNIGNKLLNFKIIKLKNILTMQLCLAICNLLPIFFCFILICKNKLKIEQKFYQLSNVVKTESSVEKYFGTPKNNFAETEPKSKSKDIKVNTISDSNIQISIQKNINKENGDNNDKKISDNKGLNNLEKKESNIGVNVEQINNINNNYDKKSIQIKNKECQLCLILTLINMAEGLSLIWTLIILYYEFKQNCLRISIYISFLKLLGEILLFPINEKIMRYSSSLIPLDFKPIAFKMKFFIILSLVVSIIISSNIFFIYYETKYKNTLIIILFVFLLFKNILSGIFTQYYKIYNNLFFKKNNIKSKQLKKYNQYFGSLGKAIIYFVGAFGLYIINMLNIHLNNKKILIASIYWQSIPELIYLILLWACSQYIY